MSFGVGRPRAAPERSRNLPRSESDQTGVIQFPQVTGPDRIPRGQGNELGHGLTPIGNQDFFASAGDAQVVAERGLELGD